MKFYRFYALFDIALGSDVFEQNGIKFQPVSNTFPDLQSGSCTENDNFGDERIFGGVAAKSHAWPWLARFGIQKCNFLYLIFKGKNIALNIIEPFLAENVFTFIAPLSLLS